MYLQNFLVNWLFTKRRKKMEKSAAGSSITITGLIFIVFLVLKLAGIGTVANWSWWWVTSPLWIGFAISILGVVIYFILMLIAGLVDYFRNR